jgi:hypothetical protein
VVEPSHGDSIVGAAASRCDSAAVAPDRVQEALDAFQARLLHVMATNRRLYFRDPELRRALGDLNEVVADICRLRSQATAPWAEAELLALGRVDDQRLLRLDTAYALFNRLSRVVSEFAGPDYILVRQAGECLREDEMGQALPWPPSVGQLIERSQRVIEPQRTIDQSFRERLIKEALLFREREHTRVILHRNARRRMKSRLLLAFAPWLLALIVGFAILMTQANADAGVASLIALAAVVGALGATLSGFFRLRDVLQGLGEVRAFGAATAIQSLAGAAFGMLLGIVMDAGVLGIPAPAGGNRAAVFAVFGFIGGFSEPFALGVIDKAVGEHASVAGGAENVSRDT